MAMTPAGQGSVVGIGSSAGGLEALRTLLPRLRASGRTRYVVAQHLGKSGHIELVARVLQRHSTLPIVVVKSGQILEPNTMYLLPESLNGVLRGGRLYLEPPGSGQLSAPSVDVLFKSISEDAGRNSIGIILSGAGSDGLRGCQAIKSRGGRILIQSMESASIAGMPGAIARAGLADEQLIPEALADKINDLFSGAVAPLPTRASNVDSESQALWKIIEEASRTSGTEFSNYKEDTLFRRIRGRMKALGISEPQEYAARVRQNPAEVEILGQLFVVSLSWFFRDFAAFEKMRALLRTYLAEKPAGKIMRVWVPGCATGEECFSFALLLTELSEELRSQTRLEIIGSDLNAQVLEFARGGCYSAKAFKEIRVPDLIEKYFVREGDRYRASNDLRAICSFRHEDVLTAAPPEQVDLVSCRNLLIYMKNELQERLINKFSRALEPAGLLFLGMSENIGQMGAAHFAPIDPTLRIFRRKQGVSR